MDLPFDGVIVLMQVANLMTRQAHVQYVEIRRLQNFRIPVWFQTSCPHWIDSRELIIFMTVKGVFIITPTPRHWTV